MIVRKGILFFFVAVRLLAAQQAQNPPAGDQPGAPPAQTDQPAAQNGTPPEQKPAQGDPNKPDPDAMREMIRTFMALGPAPDPQAVSRGQAMFVSSCGFCHGPSATGGAQGPNLVRSTLVLHDQGSAKEIGPVIRNGRPAKGMPGFPNLTDAQVHDLAQFLLGRTQAAANRMEYTIQNIVTGDPQAGQAYFQSHCASCHTPDGDLAHIAKKFEPVALEGRFLYPGNDPYGMGPPPNPRALKQVTVTLPSGTVYKGVLAHIDDFSVALRDSSGVYRSWVYDDVPGIHVDVRDPLAQHLKLLHQYSDTEMRNILAYLETLK
jgi:mono/diheme cytochrome c family protein